MNSDLVNEQPNKKDFKNFDVEYCKNRISDLTVTDQNRNSGVESPLPITRDSPKTGNLPKTQNRNSLDNRCTEPDAVLASNKDLYNSSHLNHLKKYFQSQDLDTPVLSPQHKDYLTD